MNGRYQLGSWLIDNWSRMALPFAVLALCSFPIFADANNLPLLLLYALLLLYMIHQYEEHAHGRFVEFFNSTIGKGYAVLTKVSAFWFNILEVWVLFLVSFYLAKYVSIGFAFVPIYTTIVNGVTHVVGSIVLRRYNPGLYTSILLFFPWGFFLIAYFGSITPSNLLFNGPGLLVALIGHAIIVVYAVKRRNKLEAADALRGAEART